MRKLWKTLCDAPANPRRRAMSFFLLRPAPALISSKATNTAAECSKKQCIRWRCLDPRSAARPVTARWVIWWRDGRLARPAGRGRPALHQRAWLEPTQLSPVSYTHLRAHETRHDLVCRLL